MVAAYCLNKVSLCKMLFCQHSDRFDTSMFFDLYKINKDDFLYEGCEI